MGTVAGLRTRRYHGLLVVATEPPIGRQLALASLDPVVVIGDRRIRLATHEWADGAVSPAGHRCWRASSCATACPAGAGTWATSWSSGSSPWCTAGPPSASSTGGPGAAPGAARPGGAVHLAGRPRRALRQRAAAVEVTADGFMFEDAYRVSGPGFEPDGSWYRGVRAREEAAAG